MSVIILTGKSCSGKDSVRREMEKLGWENVDKGGKMWIRMVNYPKIRYF